MAASQAKTGALRGYSHVATIVATKKEISNAPQITLIALTESGPGPRPALPTLKQKYALMARVNNPTMP